ncbi:MAG TPA: type 4a pilus biogenesis protein PilO [Candidatus Cloacimonadota bacterium]|nr:type 4a pilus biogenesis protein PilO [Candidatus Cloacimonadota bacterium]
MMKTKYLSLLLVIIIVSFAFLWSAHSMINNQKTKIDKIDKKIKNSQEQLNSAKVLTQELSEVSKIINNTLTEDVSLSDDEANNFVKDIANLCDRFQIKVVGLFPKISYSSNKILEQQFTVEVECTYVQLGRLLASIEAYDYILKVNTLDVNPMNTSKEEGKLNGETLYRISLELSIFKIVKEA